MQKRNGPKECFGCGACSRLCAKCRRFKPVCPHLDMCKRCLNVALSTEGFLVEGVYDWLVCMACKQRKVYYDAYGLCLHCSVKEYANLIAVIADEPEPEVTEPEPDFPEHSEFHEPAESLTEIEQIIVTLHQREAYPMARIGELLQLSERMVSQMYSEALEKTNGTPTQERTSP